MNEPVMKSEKLSALVDNETDAFETRRMIDELLKSEEDRKTWERYHLIGDCLRGGMTQLVGPPFLEGIRSEISRIPSEPVDRTVPSSPGWTRAVAGVGIAATVAVISLAGIQLLAPGGGSMPVAEHAEEQPTAIVEALPSFNPDPRFARYLENHAELLAPGSSAFARVRNSVEGE